MKMKFLRGILGNTRRDEIRNTVIREELKIEEIQRDILQWYGHVMCMPEDRIPKRMLQMKPKGKTQNQMVGPN
ncbi:hypothetical protein C0J52_07881 [Blattella germanica]|nr:hypothetical protein C0J52_07881 [Blattella germanica]PSN47212.1 hypothetical protein C0J52_07881 [Blattella germanica]